MAIGTRATLAELSRGRDNNLNLLRLLAALAVVYAHAYGVTGQTNLEPFHAAFGIGLGDVGVDVFFVISGFLIAKSFQSKPLLEFAWARVMRIFPALWASSLLLVAVCGLFTSPLGPVRFWARPDTIHYLLKNATMLPGIGAQMRLAFAFNGTNNEFNESLWTLPHELQMYMLLAIVGCLGLVRMRFVYLALALFGAVAFAGNVMGWFHLLNADRARFIALFFTGVSCYIFRQHVRPRGAFLAAWLLLLALSAHRLPDPLNRLLLAAGTPLAALWFGFVPGGFIRLYNRLGDYSYGTYIVAGPVQVYLMTTLHTSALLNLALALLIVLPIAAISWHGLESRALGVSAPPWVQRFTAPSLLPEQRP